MQAEPRSYKSEGLAPQLTQQRKEYLPEYSPVYSYAIYSDNQLVTYYNNYPFPTELNDSLIPKKDFVQRKNDGYDELWHTVSDDKIIVIAKKDNLLIEAITLFSYLFSAFLILVALVLDEFSIDPNPSSLETAQRISPAEYPDANPDNHHFCQPLSFHRHRCFYDFFSDQPV